MRHNRLSWLLAAGTLLTASVTLAACGEEEKEPAGAPKGAAPAGGKKPLKLTIGDLVPLTGDLADFGPPGRKAADLALEEITSAARQAGADHTVTLEHEDDQTDPQAAVSAARKLVSAENAACLAGSWASAATIPVANSVATRERVPLISPASTSDEITGLDDDGLVNRTVPPDSFQGPALAAAIADDLGGADGRTVNIGARNDAYGTGLADAFAEEWEARGGEIGARIIYDPNQPSYNSEARTITSGTPAAFVIVDFPETYQKVGPALVRTGNFDPEKAFVTDGLKSSELPQGAGRRATEGMRGTAPGSPDQGAASEAFDRLYKRAPGPDRQTFDAQNFDAVILCYLAAVAAGSTDGRAMAEQVRGVSAAPGQKFTWEQLPEAVRALQAGRDIDYDGASGPIDMNEAGDATAGVYDLFRYEGGKLDTFGEVPIKK